MKELYQLNEELLKQLPNLARSEAFELRRNSQTKGLHPIPTQLRSKIIAFRDQINILIPNDFDYFLTFGFKSPEFLITYANGADTLCNCPQTWVKNVPLIEQLRHFNWDSMRGKIIPFSETFDLMIAKAKTAPPQLPSTKVLQQNFQKEMSYFVSKKRRSQKKVYALVYREHEGVSEKSFKNSTDFIHELPDYMATGHFVITVLFEKNPITVPAIDRLKRNALKELESMPVSHASALRKDFFV